MIHRSRDPNRSSTGLPANGRRRPDAHGVNRGGIGRSHCRVSRLIQLDRGGLDRRRDRAVNVGEGKRTAHRNCDTGTWSHRTGRTHRDIGDTTRVVGRHIYAVTGGRTGRFNDCPTVDARFNIPIHPRFGHHQTGTHHFGATDGSRDIGDLSLKLPCSGSLNQSPVFFVFEDGYSRQINRALVV